ncbi:hypothetical protein RV01_GL002405 [Enterococcus dispar]|nr:hypothetical protein RV01_GL002405 [Enterococcus dispar]
MVFFCQKSNNNLTLKFSENYPKIKPALSKKKIQREFPQLQRMKI